MANPYKELIRSYPDRIVQPESDQAARDTVVRLMSGAKRTICEIGSGSGNHMLGLAERDPAAVIIGFELRYKRLCRTIEKAIRRNLDNIYVLQQDGRVIDNIFPKQALDAIYVNFPDPWEKRRTQKNRTLVQPFLDTCHKLLKDHGIVSFKSDHQGYFDSFYSLVQSDSRFHIEACTYDLHSSEYKDGNILTEFESMFIGEGKKVCYLRMARKLVSSTDSKERDPAAHDRTTSA